jgi:DNA-binding IclR family transcriptional regulator
VIQPEDHRGTLGTVRNATLLLELLSEGPAYNQLTDLADRSGMSLPTVHRLLRSLALAGLVEQDPRSLRYSLGPEVVRLSERYLDRLPVLRALGPYLVELRDTTKATVLVAILVRTSVLYVDRVDGEDEAGIFRETHRVHDALDTAAGRLLLARGEADTWAETVAAWSAGGAGRPRPWPGTGPCGRRRPTWCSGRTTAGRRPRWPSRWSTAGERPEPPCAPPGTRRPFRRRS